MAIATILSGTTKAQTYSPYSYWTFENTNSLKDSMNVANLDPNYYGSTYAINTNTAGVGVGKHLTLNTLTTGLIMGGVLGIDSAFTVELLLRPGQGFNNTNLFWTV